MSKDYLDVLEYLELVSYRITDKTTGLVTHRVSPLPKDRVKGENNEA